MNTDAEFRIWHNGLDMKYPPVFSLACENAVAIISETPLQIGDFEKIVLEAFKDYNAFVTGLSYGDKIEINYCKKRDCYYVFVVMI